MSFLRYQTHDAEGVPNPVALSGADPGMRAVLAFGNSQSGRYLRHHTALGFNQDESHRKVFDGVLTNVAFGQPYRTGTQHGGRAGLTAVRGSGYHRRNPHNPTPALRALLIALEQWVIDGVEPPASRIPMLADGSLVSPDALAFPAIPDVQAPSRMHVIVGRNAWVYPEPKPAAVYGARIPQVDADGNEIAGIRLPPIAVPVATYTGWNLYKAPYPEGELCDREGSYLPFAASRAEREAAGDPRPSLAERYGSRTAYLKQVEAATQALVEARLLLPEDAARYLEAAARTDLLT